MKKILRNNYKFILGTIFGLILSLTSVYAVDAYIESKKVSYDNPNKKITTKENVQEAIDELYERFTIQELNVQISNGYIDEYPENSDLTTFNNRILGDATGEIGPFYAYKENNGTTYRHNSWHNDYANFVNLANSWFTRGTGPSGGDLSGYFAIARSAGGASTMRSFRLVLAM